MASVTASLGTTDAPTTEQVLESYMLDLVGLRALAIVTTADLAAPSQNAPIPGDLAINALPTRGDLRVLRVDGHNTSGQRQAENRRKSHTATAAHHPLRIQHHGRDHHAARHQNCRQHTHAPLRRKMSS